MSGNNINLSFGMNGVKEEMSKIVQLKQITLFAIFTLFAIQLITILIGFFFYLCNFQWFFFHFSLIMKKNILIFSKNIVNIWKNKK